MEIIKRLTTPVPPLSLQEEFTGVMARGESTRGADGLFESLLAKSFREKT